MKDLSKATRIYLTAIYLVGALFLVPSLLQLHISEPVMFAVLCALGSALHVLKVEGATNRSHYTFSFLIFGFAMLHLDAALALLVILVSNLAEWFWHKPPWYIQLFNMSCYSFTAQIAIWTYTAINPTGIQTSWQTILGISLGMAGFTLVNHLVIGIVVWLARGENFKQSGIFDLVPLLIDLTMLTVGASLALVWAYNPYALLIFLVPAYPLYLALKIPALERQTEIDQKSGLYNHQYFMTQFQSELQRANRYDRPLSVIIADLDLLRNINNTYGHLAGDEVLKGVADILRQTVRDYDIVARFGGEEFAILLPETEIEKALERAEHLRKAVQSAQFVVPTSVEPIKATMSFGVSQRENFEQSKDEILHNADSALYRSKLSGRNRSLALTNASFVSFSPDNMRLLQPQDIEDQRAEETSPEGEKITSQYGAAYALYRKRTDETNKPQEKPTHKNPQSAKTEKTKTARPSVINVFNYISLLAFITMASAGIALQFSNATLSRYSPAEWTGFVAIALTIIFTEWFSINLYVKNTSVSTTAVPILTLVILFGPLGTLAASALYAITAAIKFRSPTNRIVFNFSNHVIAGLLINVLIHPGLPVMSGWQFLMTELFVVLFASMILFACTTTLISIGIGINQRQSPGAIWKEQYEWLIPYYLGMGFIAFAVIFGYAHASLPGILAMSIPLLLLRMSQAQYVESTRVIVNEIRQKNQELERVSNEINDMNDGLLTTLSEIIDLRDPYVLGHSKLVSQYAVGIAAGMGLHEKQIDLIRRGSLLHDIGKLGIPMQILTKPTRLTAEEYEVIKNHAALGGELIKDSPSLRSLVPIIRHHHEFFNGGGYPDGIAANQIPIEARIVAIADAIEAMTSDRPYRKGLKTEKVIEELKRHAGTQFDPLVVTKAVKFLEERLASERKLPSGGGAQVGGFNPAPVPSLPEGLLHPPHS